MAKNKPKAVIVHHSAISRFKNPDQFTAINNYHKRLWGNAVRSVLGFYGGYHYQISSNGIVRKYREEYEVGAHTKEKGMNYKSIGICLDGNFDIEEPSKEQKKALLDLIGTLQVRHNIPDSNVEPHRNYATYKTCWGKLLPSDILGCLEGAYDVKEYSWGEKYENDLMEKGFLIKRKPLHEPCTRAEVYKFISLISDKYGK